MNVQPLEPLNLAIPENQAWAALHEARTGHRLEAYLFPSPDGETYSIVRECCGGAS